MFNHFVQRNRLVMLLKNAPWPLVSHALAAYVAEMGRIAWQDAGRAVLRGRRPALGLLAARGRSLVAFLRLVPTLVGDRRRIRRHQVVPDASTMGWME
jgi:hypothetical protein